MNEYSNPIYEPKIHDFGDDYHLPDVDLGDESIPMTKVKKIRRKYQNWFDYLDAVNLYDEYVTNLKEKYGGEAKFKLAMLLGQVREYLPNYPKLRKSKRNRYYRKNRIPKVEREEIHFDPIPVEELDKLPHAKVKVRLVGGRKIDCLYDGYRTIRGSLETTLNEFDMLQAYWVRNTERIDKLKGGKKRKKRLRRELNRKTLKISLQYRSISDMLALDEKRRKDKFFNRNEYENHSMFYKGGWVTVGDQEHLDIVEKLKSIGVVFSKITRSQTKLIKKRISKKYGSRKKQRKLAKKNRKADNKFIQEISGGMFNDYAQFESDMKELTGSRRFDKY